MAINEIEATVSLLVLISLGIASLVREYNLSETKLEEADLFDIHYFKITANNFGPFTIIHGLNHFIAIMSFSLILGSYESGNFWADITSSDLSGAITLILITALYALFYPYLEVTEYQHIPSTPNAIFPASIQFHILFTGAWMVLTIFDKYLISMFGAPATSTLLVKVFQMSVRIAIFLIIPFTIIGYSNNLFSEIKEHIEESSTD